MNVKIITPGKDYSLIEYMDNGYAKRVVIDSSEINANQVNDEALEFATAYGLAFDEFEYPSITPELIMRALHDHGIWTADDMRKNPLMVRNALFSLTAPLFKTLMESIKDK